MAELQMLGAGYFYWWQGVLLVVLIGLIIVLKKVRSGQ